MGKSQGWEVVAEEAVAEVRRLLLAVEVLMAVRR